MAVVARIAAGHRGKKTGSFVECLQCGTKVYRFPRDLQLFIKRGDVRWFCSRACKGIYRKAHPGKGFTRMQYQKSRLGKIKRRILLAGLWFVKKVKGAKQ